jgi:hypothetical protein
MKGGQEQKPRYVTKKKMAAGHQWLMPASQPAQMVRETLSRKTLSQKIGLVEWLKVKFSTTKKEKNKNSDTRGN